MFPGPSIYNTYYAFTTYYPFAPIYEIRNTKHTHTHTHKYKTVLAAYSPHHIDHVAAGRSPSTTRVVRVGRVSFSSSRTRHTFAATRPVHTHRKAWPCTSEIVSAYLPSRRRMYNVVLYLVAHSCHRHETDS